MATKIDLSILEMQMISTMMRLLPDEQIAFALGLEISQVRGAVKTITAEHRERVSLSQKLLSQKKEKVHREMASTAKKIALARKTQRPVKAEEGVGVRIKDAKGLIPVRIDHKTTILIKPGQDPDMARQNFILKRRQ